MSKLTADEIRAILTELKAAVPRAWGGSYVEDFLKKPNPKPEVQWLFHMALAGNRPEVGRRLLEAGATPLGKDRDGTFAWEHVREQHAAALLLEAGVPGASTTDDGGKSWLGWAVFNQKPGYVRLLVEDGGDANHRNEHGETPLMIGARYGDVSILRMLLDAGARVNDSSNRGNTPLTIAAGEAKADAVRALLEAGADIADQGYDALWSTTRDRKKANLQIVEMLLAAGTDPNGSGSTPLLRAVAHGSPEMVRALVAGGAEVNVASAWGSPLHTAVEESRPEMATVLLALGADPQLRGEGESAGLTALEYARKRQKKKLIAVFEAERAPAPAAGLTADRSVSASWQRLEAWLKAHAPKVHDSLGPPATDEAIRALETAVGVTLPEELRAAYRLHDGQSRDLTLVPPAESGDAGYSLLSLERIAGEWKSWKGLLDGGDFAGQVSGPDAGIRDDWWNPTWLPLTTNGGGDSHCLDLAPAAGGVSGQVITMVHAEAKRELAARSFGEWLAALADELAQGEWTRDDEGGIDRS